MGGSSTSSWILRFALRDARVGVRSLLLTFSAVVIGVAALVAIDIVADTLRRSVEAQTKILLGADIRVTSNHAPKEKATAILKSFGSDRAEQKSLTSMLYKSDATGGRFVQVRALESHFPFYGSVKSIPEDAYGRMFEGNFALVDKTLMLALELSVGDEVRVGRGRFQVIGVIESMPGEMAFRGVIAPRVLIPISTLEQTGLVQFGSRVQHEVFFRIAEDENPALLAEELRRLIGDSWVFQLETIFDRREKVGGMVENVMRYLMLLGVFALIVGLLGMFTGLRVYLRSKRTTVAVLRALGATPRETMWVFLIQLVLITVCATFVGAFLGILVSGALPHFVADVVPFVIEQERLSLGTLWTALLAALVVQAVGAVSLFALKDISPLSVLRLSSSGHILRRWSMAQWICVLAAASAFCGLLAVRLGSLKFGILASSVFVLVLVVFGLSSLGVMKLASISARFFPWIALRQGLLNIGRPNNQTLGVFVSVGLGVMLLLATQIMSTSLLNKVSLSSAKNGANLILFDIQPDQTGELRSTLQESGMSLFELTPVVSMRLVAINDRAAQSFIHDEESKIPPWTLRREYRSTYREGIESGEKIVAPAGEESLFGEGGEPDVSGVSLEEGLAKNLQVGVGDSLTFDIQGRLTETRIESIRQVDWKQLRPNFFVVFPPGVLEGAPQMFIQTARYDSEELLVKGQNLVANKFPNVSVVDLSSVLKSMEEVLGKLEFVISGMASFCFVGIIVVVIACILGSMEQRRKEVAVLKVLGAGRGQVFGVVASEFASLGVCSSLVGVVLGVILSKAICEYSFKVEMFVPITRVFGLCAVVALAILVLGLLLSRSVFRVSSVELLREGA